MASKSDQNGNHMSSKRKSEGDEMDPHQVGLPLDTGGEDARISEPYS